MATMAASLLFVDTNVLIYATNTSSPWHSQANGSLQDARQRGVELVISPQILREYLAATTRVSQTGPAAPLAQVLANVQLFRTQFKVADDNPLVLDNLIRILQTVTVGGKQVHDANIVATMQAHGVTHLLTHNTADFARFAHLITVVPLGASFAPTP